MKENLVVSVVLHTQVHIYFIARFAMLLSLSHLMYILSVPLSDTLLLSRFSARFPSVPRGSQLLLWVTVIFALLFFKYTDVFLAVLYLTDHFL